MADVSFISLLKITTAIDVPMTAKTAMYNSAPIPPSEDSNAVKSVLNTYIPDTGPINKNASAEIEMESKSARYFGITFTLIA